MFGGLELAWDDQRLPAVPSASVLSLLAYLVTYRDRPHTRDPLAGTFWPELPDATTHRRLSQAPRQIRKTLAPCLFVSGTGDTAQFNTHVDALFQGLACVVLLPADAEPGGAGVPYGSLAEAWFGGLSPLRAGQLAPVVDEIWLQVLAAPLPPLGAELPAPGPPPALEATAEALT